MSYAAKAIVDFLLENDVPVRKERTAYVTKLRDKMGLSFRRIGKQLNVSPQRAFQLYRLHKAISPLKEEDEEDYLSTKELMGPPDDADAATQEIAQFLNKKGFAGKFKIWPKGTFTTGDNYHADFTVTFCAAFPLNRKTRTELSLLSEWLGYDFVSNVYSFSFYQIHRH